MRWNPIETIPMDGSEVIILTLEGVVSAWFCDKPPTNDAKDDGMYDWICFDDMFRIDGHDNNILGWVPFTRLPKEEL